MGTLGLEKVAQALAAFLQTLEAGSIGVSIGSWSLSSWQGPRRAMGLVAAQSSQKRHYQQRWE